MVKCTTTHSRGHPNAHLIMIVGNKSGVVCVCVCISGTHTHTTGYTCARSKRLLSGSCRALTMRKRRKRARIVVYKSNGISRWGNTASQEREHSWKQREIQCNMGKRATRSGVCVRIYTIHSCVAFLFHSPHCHTDTYTQIE